MTPTDPRISEVRLCLLSAELHSVVESIAGIACHVVRVAETRWQVGGGLSVEIDEAVRLVLGDRPTVRQQLFRQRMLGID